VDRPGGQPRPGPAPPSRGNAEGANPAISGEYVNIGYKSWLKQDYLLDRMTLGDLVKAYFTYPAIQVYLLLFAACVGAAVYLMEAPLPLLLAGVLCFLVYPLVEYLLHRFLLHGRWLYRSPRTAALWKRIHFDHHQNPNELSVLFGALHTTLPIIVLVTAPIGWLAAGLPGIPAGLAAGFVISFYEYGHCIQHLSYKPRLRYLQRIKRLHLAHHFHNETGNFGITSNIWDHVFGTYYEKPGAVPRSPTARNLGYTDEERERYPWVADLTEARGDDALAREGHGAS
jgi:sterol desaturase/sphingolipid hydroxylase (fatty acid hydroxylase superfamily)